MSYAKPLPLLVTEMEEMPAFQAGDAALVRASVRLLDAAWRSPVPGSLPCGVDAVARAAGLSPEQAERHWEALIHGWELRDDGRIHHPRLSRLAAQMRQRYGEEMEVIEAAEAVMARSLEGEEVFELIAPARKSGPNKGKRLYPADFTPNEASLAAIERLGYGGQEEQRWLLERFADYSRSSRRMYVDWQAAFRNYAASHITARDFRETFGYRPGQRALAAPVAVPAEGSALQRLRRQAGAQPQPGRPLNDTFAQRQLHNARAMMAAALARRQGASAEEADLAVAAEAPGAGAAAFR